MRSYYERAGCGGTEVRILHADCKDVLPGIADGAVDMILTDPPYGYGWQTRGKGIRTGLKHDTPEDFALVKFAFAQSRRLLVPGGAALVFCPSKPQIASQWMLALDRELKLDEVLVWEKPGIGTGWRYRKCYENILVAFEREGKPRWYGGHSTRNVMEHSKMRPAPGTHPSPKPLALLSKLVKLHSIPRDLIVDPFAGSGTTLVAALQEGRSALGVEIDERWCEQAARRLEAMP